MSSITASVGARGDNLEADVRLVQSLLNRQDLSPLGPLAEDGRVGSATIEAIRHFQARVVGMSSPDGRVDPDGRTFKRLNGGGGQRGTGESAETRKADRDARARLVDPRVRETGVTTRIIDDLLPHLMEIRAKIISGYLSDADLFWKVNYHWEYLLEMVEHSQTLPVADDALRELQGIRSTLLACPPRPARGYTTGALGKPEDTSSMDEITRRHSLVSQAKRSFKKVTADAELKTKSRKSAHAFDLAAAPIAHPASSKHSTGYALDIQGDNGAIRSTCKAHGATLVFDEKSHVHVEFADGVA
jgi:hypothetical protein